MGNYKKGFTIIELIIVIIVLGICFAPIAVLFRNVSIKYATSEIMQIATALAEQEMERVTSLRFSSVIAEGPTLFTGNFSNYSYQVRVSTATIGAVSYPQNRYKRVDLDVSSGIIGRVRLTTIVTRK